MYNPRGSITDSPHLQSQTELSGKHAKVNPVHEILSEDGLWQVNNLIKGEERSETRLVPRKHGSPVNVLAD